MSERIIGKFKSNMESSRSTPKKLPQGSILSHILYSIYTNTLQRPISSTRTILQYSDDVIIEKRISHRRHYDTYYGGYKIPRDYHPSKVKIQHCGQQLINQMYKS